MEGMQAQGTSASSPEALDSLVAWAGSSPNRWDQATGTKVQTREGGRGIGWIVNAESTGSGFGVVVNYENHGFHRICPSVFGSVHSRAALPKLLEDEMSKAGFWIPSKCERNENHPGAPEDEHDECFGVAVAMKEFIETKLTQVYRDFEQQAGRVDSLCVCHSLTYAQSNRPKYNDPLVQGLYLMRYLPAYLAEYWMIYRDLLASGFLSDHVRVLSLGCGSGLDLWGLHFAFSCTGVGAGRGLIYRGVDEVLWDHFDDMGHKEVERHQCLMAEMASIDPLTNVIIFPKVLSEASERDIDRCVDVIRSDKLLSDRLVVIASMGGKLEMEQGLLRRLSSSLEESQGYTCSSSFIEYTGPRDTVISEVCPGFVYPDWLRPKLKELMSLCKRAGCVDCNKPREPMLKTDYFNYRGYFFERGD